MKDFTFWWTHLSCSQAAAWLIAGMLVAWFVCWVALWYDRYSRDTDARSLAVRARRAQPPAFTCKKRY